ncbi:MAG: CHC2 zinc finger domain-containing protein [Acidobacteriota bacterium]|nr:CHC2 zinc finger domain-containing protein [Acidobacteriota bacterium]
MEEKNEWVDFKAIKEAVSMQMALAHYGLPLSEMTRDGDEVRFPCPIERNVKKKPLAFKVNLTKNVFNCFSCKARGNVLDFVATMENCSVKDAALKLKEWFNVGESEQSESTKTAIASDGQTIKSGLYCDPNPENPNLKYLVVGVARHYASYQEVVVYRELFLDYELRIQPKEDFLQLAKFVREL